MRILFLLAAAGLCAGEAQAQAAAGAPPTPAPAPAPICTTTTVVVRQGEAILSTTTNTKCEEPGSGGGFHPEAMLAAPQVVFKAMALGSGVTASPSNVRGDWRTVEAGSGRVCHLFLTSQAGSAGYAARPSGCTGALSHVTHWKFVDNAVGLFGADGAEMGRLGGERERLSGSAGGESVVLER